MVLADHSDRSGPATWILQQVIAQGLCDVLLATIADRTTVEAMRAKGMKAGDPFDMDIGVGPTSRPVSRCGSRAPSQASRRSPAGSGSSRASR